MATKTRKHAWGASRLVIIIAATLAGLTALGSTPALAIPGHVSLGVGVGSPTGLSLGIKASPRSAFEAALGVDTFDNRGGYFHLVYKRELVRLSSGPTARIPMYVGIGGYIFDVDRGFDDDLDIGVRVPLGVNFDFVRSPIQLFVEAALGIDVVGTGERDRRDLWVGLYAGIRFWL